MKKLLRYLAPIVALIAFFLSVGIVQSAPTYRLERTIFPDLDSTYELGTTTRAWLNIATDNLCLSGTCLSAWPTSAVWGSITGTLSDQTDLQTALNAKAPIASPTFTGTATTPALNISGQVADRIAIFDASKNVISADTATYPSLTELSYVKGVTSAVQTQLNAKESALTFSTGLTRSVNTITSDLSTGISGGQTAIGGTASGNNLTLQSTSHATKGSIIMGGTYYDEVNNRLGINNSTPYASLVVTGTSATTARMGFAYSNTYGQTYWTADFSSGSQNSNLLTGYINQINGTGLQWITVQGNTQVTFAGSVLAPTGSFYAQPGSAGSPSLSFNSDPDTGIYRISANQLGIAVGGGERIRLASNGFNGVSMTNPKVRWHVANNTAGGTHNSVIIVNNTNAGAGGLGTGPYTSIDFSHLNDQASDIQRKMSIGFEKITTFSRGDMVISLDGAADDNNVDYLVDEKIRLTMAGNLGVGTIGQTVSARIHAISTTEQLRLGYDASNYYSTTIGSTGAVTFNAVGSGSAFAFSDGITVTSMTNSALTSGRVPIVGTAGLMADDADLTFSTDTLTGTKIIGSTSVTSPLVESTGTVRLKGYTVATLPAGVVGDTAYVTDALAPTFLATIVGGGAVVSPVFYNGTNWVSY